MRAQEVERAAAADIEQFAAEQAAAETAEITPLLAETGAAAAETGGFAAVATGAAEALGGAAAAALAPEVAIPAGRASRRSASCRSIRGGHADGPTSGQRSCSCSGRRARGSQGRCFGLPHRAQHRASWRSGCWRLGRGSVGTGHGRDGRSLPGRQVHARRQWRRCGLELRRRVPRPANAEQQGTPQERFSAQQPRVQQPMVSRLNSSEDDTPIAQQQQQPRPQVRSRPAPQPRMPFGLNPVAQASSGSESYAPIRRPRPQRAEPSFNELRREALAREPEAA